MSTDGTSTATNTGRAATLSARTLDRVVAALGAVEVHGPDGGPMLFTQAEPGGPSGLLRVFTSAAAPRIVSTVLAVPARDVVTCMVYAFAPAESAVPHFTLDCADRPDGHAFHLDLTPRVDLATHLAYLDDVFEPLTPLFDAASAVPGLSPTGTSRRQHALMSPWMLVHLANAAAFDAIGPTVDAYADHWLSLIRDGLSADVERSVEDTDLRAREVVMRRNLFSPEVDPVWGRVGAMVGEDAALTIRGALQDVDAPGR